MNAPLPMCCDSDRRLEHVRSGDRNGIDYLDAESNPRILNLYLFQEAPDRITTHNVRITGGVRVRDIRVVELRIGRPGGAVGDARFQVVVDRPGDLSTYRLSLVETDALGVPTGQPMAEFDPFYASIEFTFREGRTSELDCKPMHGAAPVLPVAPDINYLAKDYASFRKLILDRMALTMPQWTETHVPDVGIALVEILAYVGDYLSYFQDAVATEAYLDTARKRVSVRRHLRLLDYRMHDGCNARTWICLTPQDAHLTIEPDTIFFLSVDDSVPTADVARLCVGNPTSALTDRIDVFEPVLPDAMQVFRSHESISFYTWGNAICRLPPGATRATLRDRWDQADPPQRMLYLQVGDFLCFEQVLGSASGLKVDADPTLRHVVRLTRVEPGIDTLFDPPVPVVEIEWAWEDALPFPLPLSIMGPAPACALISDISVASGNVFLVDEGFRIVDEVLDPVPPPSPDAAMCCADVGAAVFAPPAPVRYQPTLKQAGLVSTQPAAAAAAASGLLDQDPAPALPWIRVRSIPGKPDGSGPLFEFSDLDRPDPLLALLLGPPDAASWYLRAQLSADTRRQLGSPVPPEPLPAALRAQIIADLHGLVRKWRPKRDLLESGSTNFDFVAELDDDGFASLRFGNGVMGRAPEAGEAFSASYRIGLDAVGHVGAESISHVISRPDKSVSAALTVRNPLAAEGRVAPQSIAEARAIGPGSTSSLARAVTADDYAALAERNPRVQRAAAVLLWTGNRYEARVAIDPLGSEAVEDDLLRTIRVALERYRSIGHDLVVVPATYVPIDLLIVAQMIAGHSRAHVERALRDALEGFFNPDNLTFGQDLEAGRLMAVAQAVPGVQSVQVKKLKRLFEDAGQQAVNGILAIGPMEVARLDDSAARPENGRLVIELRGVQ
jgi:hypothetical protein